ncbi:MAG: hypothetical protein N3A69_18690 [Leptospiraceae bacterium]|nr:hypothetical protein [Leptospiraceae bacterium]
MPFDPNKRNNYSFEMPNNMYGNTKNKKKSKKTNFLVIFTIIILIAMLGVGGYFYLNKLQGNVNSNNQTQQVNNNQNLIYQEIELIQNEN